MPTSIVYTEEDRPHDRQLILQAVNDHNRAFAPDPAVQFLGLLLQDESALTIGGLWGRSAYQWLFVELLFVPQHLRRQGLGTRLLRQAESIARARGLTGLWLDTFDSQALNFYRQLGYTVFGELQDHPRGTSQHWLQKRL